MSFNERSLTVRLSLSVVFIALVAASTLLIQVPVPATGGYINIGDAMIFIGALLFGPIVGGMAGGLGSAIADILSYPVFAPFTLVVKGLEGFVAGYIKDGESLTRDILAWAAGSVVMVLGYFIVEAYIMGLGPAFAAIEIPGNIFQVVFGGLISIPISRILRKILPSILTT